MYMSKASENIHSRCLCGTARLKKVVQAELKPAENQTTNLAEVKVPTVLISLEYVQLYQVYVQHHDLFLHDIKMYPYDKYKRDYRHGLIHQPTGT